jgi:glutamyl-Q tRNA(Asp) synthetase
VSAAKSSTATATTGTAEGGPRRESRGYTGRFAPSPTGDLHLGSLFTAVASYLEARANHGRWLLRMEDLDRPREVAGAADRILDTLQAFGFEWHEPVIRQSERLGLYTSAINKLHERGRLFHCCCSRQQLTDEERYPGTCRERPWPSVRTDAIRLRVNPGIVQVADAVQGRFRQDVAATVGDFVVQRRDGIMAYVLAAVVDDAAQGITHVVRGADLLDNTPRQVYLQRALGLPTPAYAHVPVLMEPDGSKLAKSRRTVPLDPGSAAKQLCLALDLLGLAPPHALRAAPVGSVWNWAFERWDIARLPRQLSLKLAGQPYLP